MTRIPDPAKASKKTLKEKVARVVATFEREKGQQRFPGPRDPLAGLVQTLLSHNTTDPNAFQAYDRLRETYPTWREVHEAPVEDVAAAIRIAGLHNQKALRIQKLLGFLKETWGEYNADAMREMDFDQAMKVFGHLPGVKHKTLAVVLTFDLGVDVFPVDTHVHRVCRRLGFVPESFDPVKTFKAMRDLVPEGKSYQFHVHLIRHGRELCHARKPECDHCFVRDECLYFHDRPSSRT